MAAMCGERIADTKQYFAIFLRKVPEMQSSKQGRETGRVGFA
jgi:hypothetical protein